MHDVVADKNLLSRSGPGQFKQSDYVNLHLLGKRLEYTTNVNGAGCGCFLDATLYDTFPAPL